MRRWVWIGIWGRGSFNCIQGKCWTRIFTACTERVWFGCSEEAPAPGFLSSTDGDGSWQSLAGDTDGWWCGETDGGTFLRGCGMGRTSPGAWGKPGLALVQVAPGESWASSHMFSLFGACLWSPACHSLCCKGLRFVSAPHYCTELAISSPSVCNEALERPEKWGTWATLDCHHNLELLVILERSLEKKERKSWKCKEMDAGTPFAYREIKFTEKCSWPEN